MSFPKTLLLVATLVGATLARPALAVQCYEPMVFLVPVVIVPEGGTPGPVPFEKTGKATVTLKTVSCENAFSTGANEQVTFSWKLRAGVGKDLAFSFVGPKTMTVTSGQPMTLPAGNWVFRIDRPAPKVGRPEVLTFEVTVRFKGEYMP
ncbi:hypothetical protein MCELHM10_02738 [Paracoccaceae bacterium]|jgi:hypothetical protein